MDKKRGFITVATGNEKYYELAANLYLSYKTRGNGAYPFALICDRENGYTKCFDDVILARDIRKSTVDKLLMRYSPYEESIFLDADILVLRKIDDLWDVFADQDDVSVFGCTLPLDSQLGWFTYEGSGKFKSQVHFLISMNGGLYYFRRSPRSEAIFQKALEIIDDYRDIDFKYFSTPQDEPLMAMSMVLNDCRPCEAHYDMIILPVCRSKVTTDHRGNVFEGRSLSPARFIHFSTRRTQLFLYHYLNEINHHESGWKTRAHYRAMRRQYVLRDIHFNLCHTGGAILRKLCSERAVYRIKTLVRRARKRPRKYRTKRAEML